MDSPFRGTGRTTAILREASAYNDDPTHHTRAVVFVADAIVMNYCLRLAHRHRLNLDRRSFYTPSQASMILRGRPADSVFIDHYIPVSKEATTMFQELRILRGLH